MLLDIQASSSLGRVDSESLSAIFVSKTPLSAILKFVEPFVYGVYMDMVSMGY